MKNKIVLIEDDLSLGKALSNLLKSEGFELQWVQSLEEARTVIGESKDLILLDWMLPDGQGIDFLKELRINKNMTPVIMLTSRADLIDKILGLESGANDYMTKPFEFRELIARIRVQLRVKKTSGPKEEGNDSKIVIGKIAIDEDKRSVSYDSHVLELTKMEYELLKLLCESPGRTFSREEILNKVWGYDNYPTTRTVDTHVLQLRQKMNEDEIETIRGVGYRLRQV